MNPANTSLNLVPSAVVIMCMPSVLIGGQAQYQLLTTALAMRMIDRGYVFIPYDTLLYSLPYKDAFYYSLGNDTKLRKAYDGVLTITMDSGERNFYEAFRDAQGSYEIRSSISPQEVKLSFVYCNNKVIVEIDVRSGRSGKTKALIQTFNFNNQKAHIPVSSARSLHSLAPSTT